MIQALLRHTSEAHFFFTSNTALLASVSWRRPISWNVSSTALSSTQGGQDAPVARSTHITLIQYIHTHIRTYIHTYIHTVHSTHYVHTYIPTHLHQHIHILTYVHTQHEGNMTHRRYLPTPGVSFNPLNIDRKGSRRVSMSLGSS